ncbi:MAG: DUF3576 domain-containing protein [Alphaproteobacteria bacterium]
MRNAIIALAGAAFALSACGDVSGDGTVYPESKRLRKGGIDAYDTSVDDSVFGMGGLILFGGADDEAQPGTGGGAGVAVNSFLWRASLDTVSFMPLSSADPFGGVIITDWYSPPEAPNERFKLNVFILDRQLRADGLRVAVFKEIGQNGRWTPAPLDKETAISIENRILERARELRVASVAARGDA